MVQQWMAATLKRFVERSVCRNGGVLFLSNQCKTFVWYFFGSSLMVPYEKPRDEICAHPNLWPTDTQLLFHYHYHVLSPLGQRWSPEVPLRFKGGMSLGCDRSKCDGSKLWTCPSTCDLNKTQQIYQNNHGKWMNMVIFLGISWENPW